MLLGDLEMFEPQMISNFFADFFIERHASQTVTDVVGYPYGIEYYVLRKILDMLSYGFV